MKSSRLMKDIFQNDPAGEEVSHETIDCVLCAGWPNFSVTPGLALADDMQTPCDALIEYVRKANKLIAQYKGDERTERLTRLREEYSQKFQGAPANAKRAAQKYLDLGGRWWDGTEKEVAHLILQNKNTILEACGKDPQKFLDL